MANTKLNNGKNTKKSAKGGSVYFETASAWRGRGQVEENRRVMIKLPGVPLMAVPQGTAAEAALLELLDS